MSHRAFLAVYDTLADWESGYLAVELRTGRFTGETWQVTTVAESMDPITTMGGVRIAPDRTIDSLDPVEVDLLVLTGSAFWEQDRAGAAFIATAQRLLDMDTPVAAICGATFALARAGLLDDRAHTSAAAEYLQSSGYGGAELYRNERAVADRGLITAGPQSPVHFAASALGALGLLGPERQRAYVGVFAEGDAAFYPTLTAAN